MSVNPAQSTTRAFALGPCTASDTVEIRHQVLWPNKPIEFVLLPEDASGFHYACRIDAPGDTSDPRKDVYKLVSDGGPGSEDPEDAVVARQWKTVGIISLFLESLPSPFPPGSAKNAEWSANVPPTPALRFRKFALLPEYQGCGLGSQLLKRSIAMANDSLPADQRVAFAWCDARESAKAFYERRGMREIVDEEGQSHRFFKGDIPYLKLVMDI